MSFITFPLASSALTFSFLISIAKGMVLTAFMERTAFFDVYIFKVEVEVIERFFVHNFQIAAEAQGDVDVVCAVQCVVLS